MKQWFYMFILSIAFVANSSAAMMMPVFMLSAGHATNVVPAMPCHQVEKAAEPVKAADSKPTKKHCPNCEKMNHVITPDGCDGCSCFSSSSFLSGIIELTPLTLRSPEYTDNYLLHSSSVFPLPLLRPPKPV